MDTGTVLAKTVLQIQKLERDEVGVGYLVPEAPGETDVVGGRVVEGGQVVLL